MTRLTLETLVSICKRRGFIYQGSDVYGGLAGTWDYGPLGVELKRNIIGLWWQTFTKDLDNIYGIDTAILMSPKVWEASGHLTTFNDPMIEDQKTKKYYRLDHILEANNIDPDDKTIEDMAKIVAEKKIKSPDGNALGLASSFNLMFKTHIGPVEGKSSAVYLRPETAQGMFVNFNNIVDSFYPNLPFGIAQVGKNFRNEISPRDFIFRVRELEIMEFEYFIQPVDWEKQFEKLLELMRGWFIHKLGFSPDKIKEKNVPESDRAHYSSKTVDFEFDFPNGFQEIAGIAYRGDYDLSAHQKATGKAFDYTVRATGERLVPHVIEPTFGVDRHVLAVLSNAYKEDEINGDKRTYLSFTDRIAPVKIAVFPLLKNKPELVSKARELYEHLRENISGVMWDDNGNIGKRYRRQDEIGTPCCITVDFQTLEDNTVTLRDRDTTKQERLSTAELSKLLGKRFK